MINLYKSIWVYNYNCGGCNGCHTELTLSGSPLYGSLNVGIRHVRNPVHADILIITGKVTEDDVANLKKTYRLMTKPGMIMALGNCAESASDYINIDYFAAGCSSNPKQIIDIILTAYKHKGSRKLRPHSNDKETSGEG